MWVRIQNAVNKTGFFVDSAEIRCTGIKFVLNTFQSRCDRCSVVSDENVSFLMKIPFEKDNPFISISTYFLSNSYEKASGKRG